MQALTQTVRDLEKAAQADHAVLVSFSGGKDSVVVLDLCVRHFRKVEVFHFHFVPGLELVEKSIRWVKETYGLEVRQYPGPGLIDALRNGFYCNNPPKSDKLPKLKVEDIYTLVRSDSGIDWIATGRKGSDGINQGRINEHQKKRDRKLLFPIMHWNKFDVLAYIKSHKLPLPESDGRNSSSIDLTAPSLFWLYDHHRDDFERICTWFPYARAIIYRREWFGA